MKRIVLIISFLAIAALCASAQVYMNFSDMSAMPAPVKMPVQYPAHSNMVWNNFLCVTPALWSGRGPGFRAPSVVTNVVFIGGPAATSAGTISLTSMKAIAVVPTFQPISMTLSAGWGPNNLHVTALFNSGATATVIWKLTTTPQIFKFPPAWTNVNHLVFAPDPSLANAFPAPGSMVIYDFLLVEH